MGTLSAMLSAALAGRKVRVWGIDLGTTNSSLTEIGSDLVARPVEFEQPTERGKYNSALVPSIVALREASVWVGEGAKRMRSGASSQRAVALKTLFFECKNHMGLRKTYHQAPPELNHARKIARTVLRFLRDGALEASGTMPDRVVVTVPASFLPNQREDTLWAARNACLDLADHELLDEPTAALIDYLVSEEVEVQKNGPLKVLLFDFGGGTCDISIVEIQESDEGLIGSARATSRYHRLGGGDLDSAIVHEVLIPQLVKEHDLDPRSLTWHDKKKQIEPNLLGTAEMLKQALCREISRLDGFEMYRGARKSEVVAKQPDVEVRLQGKDPMVLHAPQLDAETWEKVLEAFLSEDYLVPTETDYRLTQSIFAPIRDALTRADIGAAQINLVLMAGGSSMIPQVRWAMERFFTGARVVVPKNADDAQLAISRGAAWHAISLELLGRPLIAPVLTQGLGLVTGNQKVFEIVPAGVRLPYPSEGSAESNRFAVPEANLAKLSLEIVTLSDRQPVFHENWEMPPGVKLGARLLLRYHVTSNGELHLTAALEDSREEEFERTILSPLLATHNPQSARVRIEELEEELRTQTKTSTERSADYHQLAIYYGELGQHEKGLDYLRNALMLKGVPDAEILNRMGLFYHELGDVDRAVVAYDKAHDVAGWLVPLFNAGLALQGSDEYERSLEYFKGPLEDSYLGGPSSVCKWIALRKLQGRAAAAKFEPEVHAAFGPLSDQDQWSLNWYSSFARKTGDDSLTTRISDQIASLKQRNPGVGTGDAKAPMVIL